jgi:hypothetical protein
MTRQSVAAERQIILDCIAMQAGGVGISALEQVLLRAMPSPFNRRTLQRRLADLLAQGKITAQGDSVALTYRLVNVAPVVFVPSVITSPYRGRATQTRHSGRARASCARYVAVCAAVTGG